MNVFISNFSCGEILISICCAEYKWILVSAQAVFFIVSLTIIRMNFRKFTFSTNSWMRESTTFLLAETSFYKKFRKKCNETWKIYRNSCRILCKLLIFSNFSPFRKWNDSIQKYTLFLLFFGFSVRYNIVISLVVSKDSLTRSI